MAVIMSSNLIRPTFLKITLLPCRAGLLSLHCHATACGTRHGLYVWESVTLHGCL